MLPNKRDKVYAQCWTVMGTYYCFHICESDPQFILYM